MSKTFNDNIHDFVQFMETHIDPLKDTAVVQPTKGSFDALQQDLSSQLASELFEHGIVPYDELDEYREERIKLWINDNYNLEER
jgi:hypothetical protein